MRRVTKPDACTMLALRCEPAIINRISAIAERDSVTRSHALRQLIEFALPHFETDKPLFSQQELPSIYLASPYSHSDASVRHQRFEAACRAAADLVRQGRTVFSPIAHSHCMCAYGLPLDWQFWQQHDRRYLEMCDEVVVLMLDGWQESVGVQAEIAIARQLGKPVSFIAAPSQADATVPA